MDSEQKDREIIRLIKNDESHRSYFFKRVSEPSWYFKLKAEEFFDTEKIPAPIESEDGGIHFPGWLPLQYFEKLAEQLNTEKNSQISNDLVELLHEVAVKRIDNPHLWSDFIRVVAKLPNELIDSDLLSNVSYWLDSEFNNSLPSHEICQNLLPKFLKENATKEDLEKSEVILKHILDLREEGSLSGYSGYSEKKYKTLVDLYWLRHTLIDKGLLEFIGKKQSIAIVYKLADNLRKILFGQVVGKNLSSKFFIRFDFTKQGLKVSFDPDVDTSLEDATTIYIKEYQRLEVSDLAHQIVENVINQSPDIKIELDAIEQFSKRLFTDYSTIWCNSLHKMDEREIMRSEIKMIHVHLLMELIKIKAENDQKEFLEIKDKFIGYEYRQPIFKRILIYVISKTWGKNKNVFWELVKNEDEAQFFSHSLLTKEIFYLLRDNIDEFSKKERENLRNIISNGPQGERVVEDEKERKYWQLQWYSALKDDSDFTSRYKELSEEMGIDAEHYETLGEIKTRVGSVSPFSPDEIIDMGITQLIEEINQFKPGRDIDSPTYDGFGRAISNAVAQKPAAFTDDIIELMEAPFFCVYNFLTGFQKAWEDKKTFEWGNLLHFIIQYINSSSFENNELIIEQDRLNIDKELIIHQIGRLISEGTKKDSNAFDREHLPLAEEVLEKIVPELEAVDDIDESNMNYPTYSLNSKAGKVLMALINYSLRNARLYYEKGHKGSRWKENLKYLYEGAIKKEIIDAFILVGFYFPQFNYLDKEWLQEKVQHFVNISEKEWKAFMGGYLFDYPARNKEVYQLMYPHYKKAISKDVSFGDLGSSTVNHIAAFYLWDLELLEDDDLITELINQGKAEDLTRLANFFWEVRDQISGDRIIKVREKVFLLWKEIHDKAKESDLEGREKVLSNLSKFMKYFEKLDSDIAPLVKSSAPYVNHDFNVPFFLEELNRLKNYGKSEETAKHVGEILLSMLKNFTPDFQESDIKELVSYMYEFKDKPKIQDFADSICAEYARRGKEFLRELYNQNRN